MGDLYEQTCEVKAFGKWELITIDKALALNKDRLKRCPECHGRVRAHNAGSDGTPAHFEHFREHKGCVRSYTFDGSHSMHPKAIRD
jgi:hypothetical protein